MYRLQICFDNYLILQDAGQTKHTSASLESIKSSILDSVQSLAEIICEYPNIRSGLDQGAPFIKEDVQYMAALERRELLSCKSIAWSKWTPSVVAYYRTRVASILLQSLPTLDEQDYLKKVSNMESIFEHQSTFTNMGLGFDICRQITWSRNTLSAFQINSVSALRNLLVAGLMITGRQNGYNNPNIRKGCPCFLSANTLANADIRNRMCQHFNFDNFVSFQTREPLSQQVLRTDDIKIVLKIPLGAIFDCTGKLRSEDSPLCPVCGWKVCDSMTIEWLE